MSEQLLRDLGGDLPGEVPEPAFHERLWQRLEVELDRLDDPPSHLAVVPLQAGPRPPERRVPAALPPRERRSSLRRLTAAAAAVAVLVVCVGVLSTDDDHVLMPPAVDATTQPTAAPAPAPRPSSLGAQAEPGPPPPTAGRGPAVALPVGAARPAPTAPAAEGSASSVGPVWEVAYVDMGDGDSEIWTVGPSGERRRRLTANAETDSAPAWSPDRRWIAQTSMRTGVSQLYLLDVASGAARHLRVEGCDEDCSLYVPRWHPDGRHVLVTAGFRQVGCQAVGVYGDCAAVLMVDALTGASVRLGSGAYADVSPDGRQLVFEASVDRDPTCDDASTAVAPCEGGELFISDLAMTTVRSLGVRGSGARWSPTGGEVLYLAVDQTGRAVGNLTVIDAASGARREISAVAGLGDWLPDGSGFVCQVVEPDGELDIHQLDLEGRLVRELASGSGYQLAVDVTS